MTETLWNGITIPHSAGLPLSTDSVLLSHFAQLPKNASVADLGSGCGTLGLLLCAREQSCRVTGIELLAEPHLAALENIRENGLEARLSSVQGDVRQIADYFPTGSFDCVISNPPYFPKNSGYVSQSLAAARSEESLSLKELIEAAAYLLPWSGRFFLVHRPERLCDIFCTLRQKGLEPKRLQFVRHNVHTPPCLLLLEARRGGKPGLSYEPELIQFTQDGRESEAYRAAYRRGDSP